jgi:peptide/nickel transport system permease protein
LSPSSASPWARFVVGRIRDLVLAFVALVVLTFLLVQLVPGDPARIAAGVDAANTDVEATRQRLGLDLPLWRQFVDYVGGVLSGDLGDSFHSGQSVTSIISVRLPYTLTISLVAIVLTLVVSVLLGLTVAGLTRGNRHRWLDIGFSWATAGVQAIPTYVVGAVLVFVFAVSWGVLPAAGADSASSYILPTVALALAPICSVSRVVRREAATVLEQDYMRTARGWRISSTAQYVKYALPNLLTSTLTLSGLVLTSMLGGAIIIESVFAWPGMGNGLVQAIINRDYPVIRGSILVLGMTAVLLNIVIDVVLAVIDPRLLEAGRTLA